MELQRLQHEYAHLYLLDAGCLTFVKKTGDQVLRELRVDPANRDESAELLMLQGVPHFLLFETVGATLMLELNGDLEEQVSLVEDLSANGRAGSLAWNARGQTEVALADDGTVLLRQEVNGDFPANERSPSIAALLVGTRFGPADASFSSALLVLERFIGSPLPTVPADVENHVAYRR